LTKKKDKRRRVFKKYIYKNRIKTFIQRRYDEVKEIIEHYPIK